MLTLRLRAGWALAVAVMVGGCAVDAGPAFEDVDGMVVARSGHRVRWNRGTAEDAEVEAAVKKLLEQPLTVDGAVEVALLNNHGLQGVFEQIGIAQADLVQAGLLRNPEFAASWRFADRSPGGTNAEYAISQDFLDVVILPLRKKVAAARLERTKLLVADAVLKLTAEVKAGFYFVQAQEHINERLKVIVEANATAAELAEKQHAAGNINDLELANQRALYGQSRVEAMQGEIALTAAREKLSRLMGASEWKVEETLAAIPAEEKGGEEMEMLAMRQRLDLLAARHGVEALAKAAGITEDFRYLTAVKVGVDTEHTPGGPNVTGPTLDLELPIFDQGQARVATVQGEYRRARQELLQKTVEVRSEVREAVARMKAERELAELYEKTLLPERANILKLTLLHYNVMLKGAYELLLAKQGESATEKSRVEAWRDYWVARAELERAVGGKLEHGHKDGGKP